MSRPSCDCGEPANRGCHETPAACPECCVTYDGGACSDCAQLLRIGADAIRTDAYVDGAA